ncbi:MAG: tripartite tricarboxylate transporter substrate binding protein [Betaproteobacteria bacterium]|nr:tripartite tricarboxylate transporter substrate binding protein [Betaproteobacteria bacterium]
MPTFLHLAALVLIAALPAQSAHSQTWPAKPLRIVVPLAPGGGNDTMARLVAAKLTESLGQQVLVENRPGGGSAIASEIVARAPADGHTLYLVSTSFIAAPSLVKNLPFDALRDFTPITRLGVVPAALVVHASLPAKSAKDLIALARAKPGEITFGSAGIGSGSHFGGEVFRLATRIDMLHVPYKGSALVTTALLSGEVMSAVSNPISSLPHVKAGRLRLLGVAHPTRWPLLPGYPTLAESGVHGAETLIWNGMAVREGTPAAIIERLHAELLKAVNQPDVINSLAADGSRPMTQTPAEFGKFLRGEIARWRQVAKATGIQAK